MKKIISRSICFVVLLSLVLGLTVPAFAVESITIEAKAALLVDLDTDQVLYEQDADQQNYPASITKIMTALLTIEAIGRGEFSLDTMVTVPAEALADITDDSSTANIAAGEIISVKDLLYCLLLASANEAANILAIQVAGDIPTFVEMMNTRAQELGMTGTHFANPHGLHDADHYSTARDIYRMAKEAMTHTLFREIVSTGRYNTSATNLSESRELLNTNGLLGSYKYTGYGYTGTIGIKTGSTGEAGYCLVAAAKKNNHTLVSVVLGAENPTSGSNVTRMQFIESKRLLEWGFTNFSTATLLNPEDYLQEVPVRYSFQSSHVVLKPAESLSALIPGEFDAELLDLRLKLDYSTIPAPVNEGDVLGSVTVIYDSQEYGTIDMVAVSSVSFSPFLAFVDSVNTILGNIYVRLLVLVALILFVIGLARRFREQSRVQRKEARLAKIEAKRQAAQARRAREDEATLLSEQRNKEKQVQRAQQKEEKAQKRQQEEAQRKERKEAESKKRAEEKAQAAQKRKETEAKRAQEKKEAEAKRAQEKKDAEAKRRAQERKARQERRAKEQAAQARAAAQPSGQRKSPSKSSSQSGTKKKSTSGSKPRSGSSSGKSNKTRPTQQPSTQRRTTSTKKPTNPRSTKPTTKK